ncbi:MAG TPA: CD225/dispanin family protein [bacterium]|nr:CD225/dispanin family protein [bacterium]
MFCPHCGIEQLEGARFCHQCGQRIVAPGPPPPPTPPPPLGTPRMEIPPSPDGVRYAVIGDDSPAPNELESKINSTFWASIAVTLFCCVIGGIVGIVYSSQAKTALAKGDIDGAIQANNTASKWCWASALLFVGLIVLYIIIAFLPFLALM